MIAIPATDCRDLRRRTIMITMTDGRNLSASRGSDISASRATTPQISLT
ncbi:hypothetical protein TIFTF001_030232 [Ficus carica]|uniref:Uncharacterized protein n=1 Tax=Ficus carica TaxID=3494 RepID=A0AA88J3G2_FICCA|nr:hypothetical protein TIFTF001_030232 [Ficus carica]